MHKQKRFTTTVKHLQKDKRKLLTISVGCDCSSSTNPPEAVAAGLEGGFIGYCWPWAACDEEVEDPCDIRGLEGLPCRESVGVKAHAKLKACFWDSHQFWRGIRLVNSNIHWKKLTLSCSRGSCATVCERATRWFAESFTTPTISFNFDEVSSLSLSVLSSLLFLGLLAGMEWLRTGMGWLRTGILVGGSLRELELLSCPRSSASSSDQCSIEVLDVAPRADL